MQYLKFLKLLIKTNMSSSVALRGSFIMQLAFMALNNLIFFSIWWIFFGSFKEVNGWTLNDLEAMYGFSAGAFGVAVVFAGGISDIARMIVEGSLDPYLVQPKSPLLQIVSSRSRASGWGDIVTAFILVGMSGYLSFENFLLILFLLVSAAAIFVSIAIMVSSLAFWIGPCDHLARQLFEFVITFSVYPQTIFPLAFKFVLFSIIPAGFIGYLPVEIIRDFRWDYLIYSTVAVVIYVLLAQIVFNRGLRRYESGNQIA